MAEYIDRDKVLEAILDLPPKMDEQGYGWLGRMGVWQMLSDFPYADVAPVVHGKWSEELVCGGMNEIWDYTCSVCGGVVHNPYDHMNYCPHCGAIMDGET